MAADMGRGGNRWSLAMWSGAALLLATPAVAMRFTDEVRWTTLDFVTFGIMLATACGAYEFIARKSVSMVYRLGAALAIGAAFFLVWVNLAVGVIGDEHNRANLMFAGVLAIFAIGACVVRFRAQGMARVLTLTAMAQAGAGAVAIFARLDVPVMLLGITALFSVLWLVSAGLFRKAAASS